MDTDFFDTGRFLQCKQCVIWTNLIGAAPPLSWGDFPAVIGEMSDCGSAICTGGSDFIMILQFCAGHNDSAILCRFDQ